MSTRLLFVVAFLQVFSLQNSFALDVDTENKNPSVTASKKPSTPTKRLNSKRRALRKATLKSGNSFAFNVDKENENPSVTASKKPSTPAKRLNSKRRASQKTPLKSASKASSADSPGTTESPSSLSPYSKLDWILSPVRRKLALKLVEEGSVSPNSIKKTYKKYAPDLLKGQVWYDPSLFNIEESLPKMEEGLSGISCKGEIMELHHLFQTEDDELFTDDDELCYYAFFPKGPHRSLDRYILVKIPKKPQKKATIVKTRLKRQEAHDLAKNSEDYVVVGNVLHPYRNGRSLINRTKFSAKRRSINKEIAKKLNFNEALAPLS